MMLFFNVSIHSETEKRLPGNASKNWIWLHYQTHLYSVTVSRVEKKKENLILVIFMYVCFM